MRGLIAGLCALCSVVSFARGGLRIINGTEVPAGTYKEVGQIPAGAARCTAILVGPRAILTSAWCGTTGSDVKVRFNGTEYTARITRSPSFDAAGETPHDVALGLLTQEVPGVDPVNIVKDQTAVVGTALTLVGYGCTAPGGGPIDNKLRKGDTAVTSFTDFDMLSKGNAALCFGDPGGPAYITKNGKSWVLGVNSTGNMKDLTYSTRTDISASTSFFSKWASDNNTTVCGITMECGGVTPPTPPTCNMQASPSTVQMGKDVVVTLMASANAKTATIDGVAVSVPTGNRTFTASKKGLNTIAGQVSNDGGTGNCSASFMVEDNPQPTLPTCTLSAIPSQIKLGDTVSLEIQTFNATSAKIDGVSVNVPNDKRPIRPSAKGTFSARGDVTNNAGSNSCMTSYTVTDDTPPETPNFAVVPAFCGNNTLSPASKVQKVCIGVLRHDTSIQEMLVKEALVLTYDDGKKEVMPVIARTRKGAKAGEVIDDVWLYTNNPLDMGSYFVFETKLASITRSTSRQFNLVGEVPTFAEGRSMQGWYFMAPLSPTAN